MKQKVAFWPHKNPCSFPLVGSYPVNPGRAFFIAGKRYTGHPFRMDDHSNLALTSPHPMPQTIAFLRAINVGGHTVKMADLRQLFEALGFSNVETFIASGNVIFDAAGEAGELERKIEPHLHKALGYEVITFLRTIPELAAVAEHTPFANWEAEAENTLFIAFLKDVPTKEAQEKLMALENEIDHFHVHQREAYWLRNERYGKSEFIGKMLEKALGPATMRNSTTVRKMAAKYSGQ